MVTRRGSRSFSLSDLDHSEGEQSLLTLNAPRRQSLGLGVTHCPLPYVQEEEEKEEGDDDEEVCGFDISIYIETLFKKKWRDIGILPNY